MNQPKRIFIIGHIGAGKGVLAQALAKKLGWQFIDADFALAPTIGRNLDEIIGTQGKAVFHHCLSEILSWQITKENIVVTTDDSIVCHEKNRQLLSSEFAVYLKVSTSVQLERISSNRPLLPVADYKAFLEKIHDERDALYNQISSFSISSDSGSIEEHVLSVINAMGNR
ncbi:shikimate kinase [Aquicella lusitana]|uniref:Shikimate kinase n=1 Tax=Aquicella lusitana TaxID=254246 RepID=A0A370GTH8_9COXI|nr:shikimate kinase [Aquicella lusitana]RDI46998.1 shikimate kinase [Aquicella lusitana]VVC73887.1 Shikimate kinase 1 [Aquicella lusitana]